MLHKSTAAASKSIAISSGKTAQNEVLALENAMAACRRPWWQGVRLAVLAGGVLAASGTGAGAATFTWTGSVPAGGTNPTPSFSVTDPANWTPTGTPGVTAGDIFTVSTPLTLTQILSGPFKVGSITVSNVTTLQREATATTATLDFDNGGSNATVDVTGASNSFTVGAAGLPVAVHLTDSLSVNSTVGSVGAVTLNGVVDDLDNTNVTTNKSITVGGGVLNLNGANTYTGGTVINAGKVVVGNASGLGAATGVVTLGSAVAATPPAVLDLQAVGVNAYNVVVADGSTNAVINEKSSANTNTLGTLTFDNTGGGTTPAALQVNPNQAAGVAATVNFGGVTLNGVADTINVGGANGNATTVVFGADGLKTGITGLGTLVKDGAGTLQLDGDSTTAGFAGGFEINAGNVVANHVDALSSSSVTIRNGSLQLDKVLARPSVNAVTVSNGATAMIVENSGTGGVGANAFGALTFEDGTSLTPPAANVPTTLNVNAGANSSTSASVTFTGVTLNGAADTINVGVNASVVVSGAIIDIFGGGGTLNKNGAGTLELQVASGGYSGGITVSAGTLIAKNVTAIGLAVPNVGLVPTGAFSAGSNLITLSVADPSLKIGDVISGLGISPGSQIVAINGSVLTLNTKTTALGASVGLSIIKPDVALASGAKLELQVLIGSAGGPAYNVSAGVGGAGSTVVLNSVPVVSGVAEEYRVENVTAGKNAVITVNPGTNVDVVNNQAVLVIGDNITVPLAPTGGLSIDTSVTLNVQNGVSSGTTVRIDGEVKGDGGKLIKSGSGVLELTNNANSYSGGTVINAGTVRMGHNDPTATPTATKDGALTVLGSGPVTIAGGALDVNRNTYDAGEVFTVGVGGRIFDGSREKDGGIKASREFSAPVTGVATVEVSLSGTAELVKSGLGELILAAKNTYTGGTVVNEGKLTLSGTLDSAGQATPAANDTLAANQFIRVQGGTLDLGGSTQHLGGAEFKLGGSSSNAILANGTIEKTSGVFTADVNPGQTATVEATAHLNNGAGGSVGLVKDGRGTLVLAGTNGYNSTTRINDGSVQVGDGSFPEAPAHISRSLGSGSVELHGGNLSAASGVTAILDNSIAVSGNASIGNATGTQLTLTGGIAIDGGHQLAFGGAVQVDGVISEAGPGVASVLVDATGKTVKLNATNTYSGGTTVTNGVLVVGAVNALGSGAVTLSNGELSLGANQNALTANLNKGTVSGAGKLTSTTGINATVTDGNTVTVSGDNLKGALTKAGAGKVVLNGSNTELTAITLSDGALEIGANQNALTAANLNKGTVSGAGKLTSTTGINATVTDGNTVTVSGDNLKGVLTKAGAGKVALNGFNTELAGIVLNDGELSLGADQSTSGTVILHKGTVSGTGRTLSTANGITVNTVAPTDSVAVSANLAGNLLTKNGSGNLTLSGNNASLNGLTIDEGAVSVTSNAALGTGNVNVGTVASLNGIGLKLDQAAPTLTVNGTLNANSLTVGAGKILKGNGVVNAGVVLAAGAQISPGNSPGMLTVGSLTGTGDYIWERTAPDAKVVSPASVGTAGKAYDQITVTGASGSSQLSGITVRPRNLAGAEIPVTNTTAGGESFALDQVRVNPAKPLVYGSIIKGVFTDLPRFGGSDTAVIKIRLVQNDNPANGVDLVVDRKSYSQFAQNRNGAAFGSYLDSQLKAKYEDAGKVGGLLRELDSYSSNSDVTARLRAIDPTSAYASMFAVNVRRALVVSSAIDDHLDVISAEGAMASSLNLGAAPAVGMQTPHGASDKAFTAWTAGYAASSSREAAGGYGSLQSTDNGGMLGLEGRLGNLTVGVVASTGQATSNFEDPSMKVDSDNWTVGGYGSVALGGVTLDATALWGNSDDKSSRATAKASYGSNSTQLGLGVSVNLLSPGSEWQITPVARLKYVSYSQDALEESGSSFLFKGDKMSDTALLSKLGMRVSHRSKVSKDVTLGLDGAAYWVHDFDSAGKGLNTQLLGANGSFQAIGRKTNVESAQVNLGVHATFSETVTIRLSGQQDVGSASSQSSGIFSIALNF